MVNVDELKRQTPEILWPAFRQYRHNTDLHPGFVDGFDYAEVVAIVTVLQASLADMQRERDEAVSWNHRVAVCKGHVGRIVDDVCVICLYDVMKAEAGILRAELAALRESEQHHDPELLALAHGRFTKIMDRLSTERASEHGQMVIDLIEYLIRYVPPPSATDTPAAGCETCAGTGVVAVEITTVTAGCCGRPLSTGECCGNAEPVPGQDIDYQPCPACHPATGERQP